MELKLPVSSSSSPQQDLAFCFQYFLYFGRFLGVIPFTGIAKARVEQLKFKRWKSIASFTTLFIMISLGFCMLIAFVGFLKAKGQNANGLIWSAHLFVFYGTGFFIYTYFYLYSEELILVFKQWKSASFYYRTDDKHLRRDVNLIAGLILLSITLENTTWHLRHIMKPPGSVHDEVLTESNYTTTLDAEDIEFRTLKSFYYRSEPEWAAIIPYHPTVAIFTLIASKWALFSWNYYDILLIVISRVIYKKYKMLNQIVKKVMFEDGFVKDGRKWTELISDHLTLTSCCSSFEQFLSPIVFVSYAANIYDVSIHLSLGLSPVWNSTTIGTIYSIWAFAHLTMRLFLVTLTAGKINEHAMEVFEILKKCPLELYTVEVKKFERQLFQSKLGLHGFGCFVITKSFMLRLLGVIFTIEMVLLQSFAFGSRQE